jgi:hypothetical protein
MNRVMVHHMRVGLRSLMYIDGHNRISTHLVEPDPGALTVLGVCGACRLKAYVRFDLVKHQIRTTGDALDLECTHKTKSRFATTRAHS